MTDMSDTGSPERQSAACELGHVERPVVVALVSLAWFERRRERQRLRRLNDARRELIDAVYRYDKWTFGLSPSGKEDAKERCLRAIRRYEALGGDALDKLEYGFAYLASEAMPETFERYRGRDEWRTRRIGGDEHGRR